MNWQRRLAPTQAKPSQAKPSQNEIIFEIVAAGFQCQFRLQNGD